MDVRRTPQARSEIYWEQQALTEDRNVDSHVDWLERRPAAPDEQVSLVDHYRAASSEPRRDREYPYRAWAAG
ncbi:MULTISPECIES: hypothetical protein [unclassified Rhodococcus (in: high G+C Gram-positive bacteria)]|uniref:hypothetical protein n=1 Tax=unclassified Rhodococcus (in: high G+C Gram-positive bacteria) TaxID=192944 RepID=UPI001639CD35|nr:MULTISPECIES: hypothetical protein [unclassified Rhodococcus (in: high G+C Gram-positive bacteria)]MBC2641194.1 hypothetical protein [Rhodococcus sp. 3A]MBC2894060.1 hypothetical protein [Rhodococcus sp. 4CII]